MNTTVVLLNEKGKTIIKNIIGPVFGATIQGHPIHAFFDKNNNLTRIAIETTAKANKSSPNLHTIQIKTCPVSTVSAVTMKINLKKEDNDYLIKEGLEQKKSVTSIFLNNLDEENFIDRDSTFLNIFMKTYPEQYLNMQNLTIKNASPSVYLYNGFKIFTHCDYDIYNLKKERKNVYEIVKKNLVQCAFEDVRTKMFFNELQKIEDLIKEDIPQIHDLWEKYSVEKKVFDKEKLKKIGDSFSNIKNFKEAAEHAKFDLFDGMPDKSFILTKTHKSLTNDLTKDNWLLEKQKRAVIGETRKKIPK